MNDHCPLCLAAQRCADREHPALIATLDQSHAVLAETQGAPGWCVLILRDHHEHLDDLPLDRQLRLWADAARLARAQRAVLGPVRINYECLGNQVPHIHWHLIPRHADDPQPRDPVWLWPKPQQAGSMPPDRRAELIHKLRAALQSEPPASAGGRP